MPWLLAPLLLAAPPSASAQLFIATGRDTLKGLSGVEVLVEPVQADLDARGVTTSAMRTSVVEQLRGAGIVVYPSQRDNPGVSKPYLYVHVNAAGDAASESVAVSTEVHLRQTLASLVTESRVVDAMSWDAHSVALIPDARLGDDITGEIRVLVARFIADWKAVH